MALYLALISVSSGLLVGKKGTRLSKSDIRVQIVHSDHNAARGNDDEEDVKEPMVSIFNIKRYIYICIYIQREREGDNIWLFWNVQD